MKSIIKYLSISFIMMFGVLLLTGCGSNKNVDLVGRWNYKDKDIPLEEVFAFAKDGTGTQTISVTDQNGETAITNQNFTYEVKKNKILVTYEKDTDVFEFKFKFKDDILLIYDTAGTEMQFVKE